MLGSHGGVARDPPLRDCDPGHALDAEAAIAEAEAQFENKRVTRDEKVAALAAKTALVASTASLEIRLTVRTPTSTAAMGYVRKS